MVSLCVADYVAFLRRCKAGLKPNGIVGLKENITSDGFVLDREDASITRYRSSASPLVPEGNSRDLRWDPCRSDKHMRALIAEAGLSVVTSALQTDFPRELFAVRMYACR